MSDWQPGDLALCVNVKPSRYWREMGGPSAGQISTVVRVTHGKTMVGLVLQDFPAANPLGFAAVQFHKIRSHKPDAFDREVIELYTGKPAQVPE